MNRNFLGAYLLPWQPLSTRVKYESFLNRYNSKFFQFLSRYLMNHCQYTHEIINTVAFQRYILFYEGNIYPQE